MVIRNVRITRFVSAGLALIALGAAACDGPRCKPIERCDIRQPSCHDRALRLAACLRDRGERADLDIAVEVLDLDSYRKQAERELREAEQDDERRESMRRGLALIGLGERGWSVQRAVKERSEWLAGYYETSPRQIVVIDRGGAMDEPDQVLTLVHEMTHALQDAAGQLDTSDEVSQLDAHLARRALIEGEATLVTDQAGTEGYGLSFFDLDYAAALARYRSTSLANAVDARSPFERAYSYFTYAYGASYLWGRREKKHSVNSAAAFDELPQSTHAVMEGDPTLPPNDLGDEAVPDLPDLTLVGSYHLGRFLYEVFRWPAEGVPLSFDWAPWGDELEADTFSVFIDAEGNVLTSWRLRFWHRLEAEDFAAHLIDANPEARIEAEGRDIWWLTAERDQQLQALPATLSWTAAPDYDFGFAPDEEVTESARRVLCAQPSARR